MGKEEFELSHEVYWAFQGILVEMTIERHTGDRPGR